MTDTKETGRRNEELTPTERLEGFFDEGTWVPLWGEMTAGEHPLEVVCGYGEVAGAPAYAFSQGGAMGVAHVEKMKKLYRLALKNGYPLVGFYDSHGVELADGLEVMDAFGELLLYQNNLSGVIPQISVVVGACIGLNAMLACASDYVIMSSSGVFFSSPPTASQEDNIATAQNASREGVAHRIVDSQQEGADAARELLTYLPTNNLAPLPQRAFVYSRESAQEELALWLAEEGSASDLPAHLGDEDSFYPLFPDFGKGVTGGFMTLEGLPMGILATHGEALGPEECVKISRLVSVWDSYHLPITTLVDTTGLSGQSAGAARDMAKVAHVLAEATTPKVAVIVGDAVGAGYVSLASQGAGQDHVVAWEKAFISPLQAHTGVAFLEGGRISPQRSRKELEQEFTDKHSATAAAAAGLVDQVISPLSTRETLVSLHEMLAAKRVDTLPKKHGNIPF